MKKTLSNIQCVLFCLLAFGLPAYAQEHGALDTTFFDVRREAGSGFNGSVDQIELQSDGNAVVAGRFTTYNGYPAPHVTRLDMDGFQDNSFISGTGFTHLTAFPQIYSLLILPDDRILVGGEFNSYNGFPAPNIVRLSPDGIVDQTFEVGLGFNDRVQSIVLQPDGKVLIGGWFTSYSLESAPYLIRLNPDGSKDPLFSVDPIVESKVNALGLQPDGKILVHSGNDVIRLNPDGSYDPSFTLPAPFGEEYIHEDYGPVINRVEVTSIKVLENGKILLAGFMQTSLKWMIPLVRLHPDGSRDLDFPANDVEIGGGRYNKIVLSSEGEIYSIGMITQDEQGVQRFNVDGTKDSSFDPGYASVGQAITLQANGKLIAAMSSTGRNVNMYRFNEDGSIDLSYNPTPEFDDKVTAVAVQNDGNILLGGEFSVYNGQLSEGVVRLNTDGAVDPTFNAGTGLEGYGFGDLVSEIIPQDDGKIVIIGSITSYNGVPVGGILRLNPDGTLDDSFDSGDGFNFFLDKDIALQEDGKILVAGGFSSYDGEPVERIIRLNADGSRDLSFYLDKNVQTRVLAIHPLPDGKILIGGRNSGNPKDALVRLNQDGSKDGSFDLEVGLNDAVLDIVVQPDDKIVVRGGGPIVPGRNLIRLNPDGTIDQTFNAEIEVRSVGSTILQPDGKFLVSTDSNDPEKTIIRLNSDGTIDPSFHIGSRGFDIRAVHALALQPGGGVIVGGEFTHFNGIMANRILRLFNNIKASTTLTEVIRINAGGSGFDFNGEHWGADQHFTGGKIYNKNNPIGNTENDRLYQSERYGNVIYDIPVPEDGLYVVELHFAEIHWQKAGARLFRMTVEGGEPSPVIDLYGDHGGANAAYVLRLDDISVADGKLTLELISEKDNAKISGIAVFKQNPSTEPNKLRINSGGGELVYGEEQWLEDQYFTGGRTYSINSGEIHNTHRDELYRSERYGDFTYSLPATEGLYTLELHLAEIHWEAPDSRIFDIFVENGQFEFAGVDLYRDYRGSRNATVIVAKNIKVTDGFLDIAVSKTKDNGKISGLVMYKQPENVDPHDGFITRINSGGGAMQFDGEDWQEDRYYTGGRTFTNASEEIGNTDKDALYFTERYGEFTYEIPVPEASLYTVELHFAEIHWNRINARIFDVDVEDGQYALEDLDLYRELGGSHQSRVYVGNNIAVADGFLNISFSKVKDNPKVLGIVVYKQPAAAARLQSMESSSKAVLDEESGNFGNGSDREIRIYPNPAKDRVRLEFHSEHSGEWNFVLVNSSGTGTHLASLSLEIGEYLLEFDLSKYNLSPGTYYIHIANKRGGLATKKVIIH